MHHFYLSIRRNHSSASEQHLEVGLEIPAQEILAAIARRLEIKIELIVAGVNNAVPKPSTTRTVRPMSL
jgi:hypothetical protein